MDARQMQNLIDRGDTPRIMTAIAQAYLAGTVLRDKVAAEAWLMKAIETEDPLEAPKAMAVLAREILGKDQVLTQEDIQDIRHCLKTARGQERQELLVLLELAGNDEAT